MAKQTYASIPKEEHVYRHRHVDMRLQVL